MQAQLRRPPTPTRDLCVMKVRVSHCKQASERASERAGRQAGRLLVSEGSVTEDKALQQATTSLRHSMQQMQQRSCLSESSLSCCTLPSKSAVIAPSSLC